MWKNEKDNDREKRRVRGRKGGNGKKRGGRSLPGNGRKIKRLMHPEGLHPVSMREDFLRL